MRRVRLNLRKGGVVMRSDSGLHVKVRKKTQIELGQEGFYHSSQMLQSEAPYRPHTMLKV